MIIGSILWLAAVVLRLVAREVAEFTPEQLAYFDGQTFRVPHQLALYQQNPALLTAGYALFAAASVLLVPALLSLAKIIAAGSPVLATVGGTLATLSLLARMYFSGVDLTAFELVDALGLEAATAFVLNAYVDLSYGLWFIPVTISAGSIIGCLLLANRRRAFGNPGRRSGSPADLVGMDVYGCSQGQRLGHRARWHRVVCVVLVPLGIKLLKITQSVSTAENSGRSRVENVVFLPSGAQRTMRF